MLMLTRGVCLAIPRFFAIAFAEVTTPLAMRPGPPSFSLAKTKIISPLAMSLPAYIVFCALNTNVSTQGSLISALIANIILLSRSINFHGRPWARPNETQAQRPPMGSPHTTGLRPDEQDSRRGEATFGSLSREA